MTKIKYTDKESIFGSKSYSLFKLEENKSNQSRCRMCKELITGRHRLNSGFGYYCITCGKKKLKEDLRNGSELLRELEIM